MRDWWKSPVLQGPENDYGEYDYLIEPIPQNSRRISDYGYRCSECGKYHKWNMVYTAYFRTMDGYDSISDEVCLFCEAKRPIRSIRYKIRREIKVLKLTIELKHDCSKKTKWSKCYKLAKEIQR